MALSNTDDLVESQEFEVKVVLNGSFVMSEPSHKALYTADAKVGDLFWVTGDIMNGFFPIKGPPEYAGKWIYIGFMAPTGKVREKTNLDEQE